MKEIQGKKINVSSPSPAFTQENASKPGMWQVPNK